MLRVTLSRLMDVLLLFFFLALTTGALPLLVDIRVLSCRSKEDFQLIEMKSQQPVQRTECANPLNQLKIPIWRTV